MKRVVSGILLVLLVSCVAAPPSSAPPKSPCACEFEYIGQHKLNQDS